MEAKIAHRAKAKYGGEERQIRAAETQYSVMHRMLNLLVVLATLGAALMVFDQVRAFGASLLTSAGIVGLVAGVAAQRTLQKCICWSPTRHYSADRIRRCSRGRECRRNDRGHYFQLHFCQIARFAPVNLAGYLFFGKAVH